MSKEYSEALDRLYKCNDDDYTLGYQRHDYKLLQEALQRLEAIDNAKPSEALKCIDVLKEDGCITTLYQGKALETIRQTLLKAQEQEKVLDIIKKKNVDVYNLKTCINLEHYNSEIRLKNQNNTYSYEIWYELTQEEFDLLKRYFG